MSNMPNTIGDIRQALWDSHIHTLPEMSWAAHTLMVDEALSIAKGHTAGIVDAYEPLFLNLARSYKRVAPVPPVLPPEPRLADVLTAVQQLAATVAAKPPTPAPIRLCLDAIELAVILDTLVASRVIPGAPFNYDITARQSIIDKILHMGRTFNIPLQVTIPEPVPAEAVPS